MVFCAAFGPESRSRVLATFFFFVLASQPRQEWPTPAAALTLLTLPQSLLMSMSLGSLLFCCFCGKETRLLNFEFFSLCSGAPKKILDTILDHIGNTPLVRINKIGKSEGLECEIRTFLPFSPFLGAIME
jgi:hypothetical protein